MKDLLVAALVIFEIYFCKIIFCILFLFIIIVVSNVAVFVVLGFVLIIFRNPEFRIMNKNVQVTLTIEFTNL